MQGTIFLNCGSSRDCQAHIPGPTCSPRRRIRRCRLRPPDGVLSRSLQIGVGAGEDFDQPRFRGGVGFKPLADGLAQMVEGGLD